MLKQFAILILASSLLCGVFGCQQDPLPPQQQTTEPVAEATLFSGPVQTEITETVSEALPVWRRYRQQRPTLVLMAENPYLQKIPERLLKETLALVSKGSAAEIARRASRPAANPLFFPTMAVSAAIQADLISEVIWILPIETSIKKLNLQAFRENLARYHSGSDKSLPQINLDGEVLSGTLLGKPFRIVSLDNLPELNGPILLHIDLSFFSPLYRHEIGTPIYPLIYKIFSRLREKSWNCLQATVSTANLSYQLPLPTRFLAADSKTLLEDPTRLELPVPNSWIQRAQILYLENFIQKEKIRNIYLAMEAANPNDPSVRYGLYQIMRRYKEPKKAFAYLDQAIALDPTYAIEYQELAQVALKKKRPDAALRMLDKTAASFPDDPFIALQKVQLLIDAEHGEQALPILDRLKGLTWSPVYAADMPIELEHLSKLAQGTQGILASPP